MRRLLLIAAFIACGLLTARCATEGAGSGYYDPYYYDDPWYGYGYGFGAGVIIGGCCGGDDVGPPPHPEHPIVNPPGEGDRPRPEHPIANAPGASPKADTRPSGGGSSSSRPTPAPRSAAPSRGGGGFGGGGGRGGGGRR